MHVNDVSSFFIDLLVGATIGRHISKSFENLLQIALTENALIMYNIKSIFLCEEFIMEQLLEILRRMHPDVDFETNDDLIGEGVLDSLDIVTLITEINTTFDVSIPAEEVIPENFNSAEAIFAMIQRLDEE